MTDRRDVVRVYVCVFVCVCLMVCQCVSLCVSPSLEVLDAIRRGRDVESPHVLVHLREALLDVVLSAALPHCGEAETL